MLISSALWADIIDFFVTRNVQKKRKKKFDEDRYYRQRKFSHLMKNLKNFNEIFRKDVTYDTNKNHKETGFHLFF